MQIANSQIRPETTIKPHHIRHLISGTLVFLLGVAVNEGLVYYRKTHEPPLVMRLGIPPVPQGTNTLFLLGVDKDGKAAWMRVLTSSEAKRFPQAPALPQDANHHP